MPAPRAWPKPRTLGAAISLLQLRQGLRLKRRDDVTPGRLHVDVEGPVAEVRQAADLGDGHGNLTERRVIRGQEWAVGTGRLRDVDERRADGVVSLLESGVD